MKITFCSSNDAVLAEIGSRIKACRIALPAARKEMAQLTDLSQRAISNPEAANPSYCQFLFKTSLLKNSVFFSEVLMGCSLSVFTSSLIYCREQFRISAASAALMIRSEANARKSSIVMGMRFPIL